MKNKILRGWPTRVLTLFLILFFSSNLNSFAQPAYTYNYDLEDYGTGVWDVSGTFTDDSLGCTVALTLVQDERGRVTGGGFFNCIVEDVYIQLDYNVMGNIRQKQIITTTGPAYIPTGRLNIRFNGTASYQGRTLRCTATQTINADINLDDSTMYGTAAARVCIAGLRCASESLSFTEPLDPGMDGSSNLNFEVTQGRWNLTGTQLAELTLSNGRTSYFSVTGTYNARRNESRFRFQGVNLSRGCSLNITIDEGSGDIILLNGSVHGQRLSYRKP